MIVLHTGFDGLDLALKTQAPLELIAKLERAKSNAAEYKDTCRILYNGLALNVSESGGKGGYAYRFDTGADGAIWFIKKPKAGDKWGVRLSCSSQGLALKGLDAMRKEIMDHCDKLGLIVPDDGVSISRVDYAIDLLAPEFALKPEHFVMHARARRKTFADLEDMQTHGPSGRYTSVTIGKQPGRQVIVYDKREEVLAKTKLEWLLIWNSNLEKMGCDPLDINDPALSQVWRVELRLGKKALRDRSNIRGFGTLYERVQGELIELAEAVTLHTPTADTNRSRWPLALLWKVVKEHLSGDIFGHDVDVPPEAVRQDYLLQKQFEFERSIASYAVTLAVLKGYQFTNFPSFLEDLPFRIIDFLAEHPRDVRDRFVKARVKYAELFGE